MLIWFHGTFSLNGGKMFTCNSGLRTYQFVKTNIKEYIFLNHTRQYHGDNSHVSHTLLEPVTLVWNMEYFDRFVSKDGYDPIWMISSLLWFIQDVIPIRRGKELLADVGGHESPVGPQLRESGRKNCREATCIDHPPACMYILRTKFWIFLLPAITTAFNYISLGRKEPTSGSSVWYWNNVKCLHS